MANLVTPIEQIHATVGGWPENRRVDWAERAAIIQYDAKMPRELAERMAYFGHQKASS
jgi:hypothetical protein